MRKFFIVGLPRSRTYWMSVFLYCTHEAIHYHKTYAEFLLNNSPGDSTTCYPWIKDYITDQRVVVIERDINESFESSKELFPYVKMDTLIYIKSELDSIDKCMRVNYEDISDKLGEIWDYCYEGNIPFDEERAANIKNVHMENYTLIESTKRELEKIHANAQKTRFDG